MRALVSACNKEARIAKNISQAELARRVGVSRSTICNYESGSRESPSTPVIAALADALQVPFSELLSREELTKRFPKTSVQIQIPRELVEEMLADDLIDDKDPQESIDATQNKLFDSFQKLNSAGKAEALKRVEELTQLPQYTRENV